MRGSPGGKLLLEELNRSWSIRYPKRSRRRKTSGISSSVTLPRTRTVRSRTGRQPVSRMEGLVRQFTLTSGTASASRLTMAEQIEVWVVVLSKNFFRRTGLTGLDGWPHVKCGRKILPIGSTWTRRRFRQVLRCWSPCSKSEWHGRRSRRVRRVAGALPEISNRPRESKQELEIDRDRDGIGGAKTSHGHGALSSGDMSTVLPYP